MGACRDCSKSYMKKWRTENIDTARKFSRESVQEWRKKKSSKKKMRNYMREYQRKTRPRLARNFRSRISISLRKKKAPRLGKALRLLNYSIDDLRAHLEKLFLPGMSWENYGEWEIDHRKPIVSFSFSSPTDPEFLECWSLSNLQPLWAKDNRSKGSRLNYEPSPAASPSAPPATDGCATAEPKSAESGATTAP